MLWGKKIIILVILRMVKIIGKSRYLNLINTMVNGKSLNFGFFSLLYGFGTIILLLKKENKLFIPLV